MAKRVTVRWSGDTELSLVHAAMSVAANERCTDPKTEQVLMSRVTAINNRLASSGVDVGTFWRRLMQETAVSKSVTDRQRRQNSEIALAAGGASELQLEQTTSAVIRLLAECRRAYTARYPKLDEQLVLRGGPLKDRWESYGQGLLGLIAHRIWDGSPPSDWWPPRISGVLIQPIRGGYGNIDAESQRFWMEAMLTDVDREVPEVLRIAWLVSLIASEILTADRSTATGQIVSLPWALGLVPIVLSAAAELEITPGGQLPIALAIGRWGAWSA
ncbi:MAG: hypothetical protein AAGA03_18820, partial [Planctomycetota bacterium]